MKLDREGTALIHESEDLRLNAYADQAGVYTIGYGTTRYPDGTLVRPGETCTREQAEYWFGCDAAWAEKCVNNIGVELNQKMFNALVSMAYNIGAAAFNGSTISLHLRNRNYIGAQAEFDKWIKTRNPVSGRLTISNGLRSRRDKEQRLFNDGIREALVANQEALAMFNRYLE